MSTVVLAREIYGQGTHQGIDEPCAGKSLIVVTGQMNSVDGLNVANSCQVYVEVSYDGGKTWGDKQGYTWQGGVDPKNPGQPNPMVLTNGLGANATDVRASISLPQALSIGLVTDLT